MSEDQPIKVLSSLVDTDYKVLDPTVAPKPPGSVVDVVSGPFTIPTLDADYTTMRTVGSPALLDQFLLTCNQNTGGIAGDLHDFVAKYVKFLVANSVVANTDAAIKAAETTILNSFVTAFEASLSFTNLAESASIQALFPNLGTYGVGNSDDPDQYYMANAMWKDFADSYTYQPNGAVSNTPSLATGVFQQLRTFTAVTATIMIGTTVTVNAGGGTTAVATSSATPSFEKTFAQYFPSLPVGGAVFVTTLQNFARAMVARNGYFSASRHFTSFVSYVQELSNTIAPLVPRLPVQDVRILNEVFFLIVKMITSIQNVAATQADRLALYTAWQKGYTDLLNQVHVFTGSSKDRLRDNNQYFFSDNPSLTDVQKRRQDEQGNFNAGMVQQITAYKDTVSEDAKALQSRVNASSDAFNEQANSATAILQELATILSAIFR